MKIIGEFNGYKSAGPKRLQVARLRVLGTRIETANFMNRACS